MRYVAFWIGYDILLHTFNFLIIRGEIDIFNIEDDIVEFGIHDTSFRVCIEQETYWVDEAVSFNSFTDTIQYEDCLLYTSPSPRD